MAARMPNGDYNKIRIYDERNGGYWFFRTNKRWKEGSSGPVGVYPDESEIPIAPNCLFEWSEKV